MNQVGTNVGKRKKAKGVLFACVVRKRARMPLQYAFECADTVVGTEEVQINTTDALLHYKYRSVL